MNLKTEAFLISMVLLSSAGRAATHSAATRQTSSSGHYIEYACTFGKYGPVVIHEGGVGTTYIVVHGKKYPSTGGEDFVQSDTDDGVAVMFDRRGNPSYRGEVPGRNCRVSRR